MAKKVLIFSLAYYPKHIGGAEVAIKEITDRISPDEIEFHMVTNRYDASLAKTEKIGNVLIHRIGITTKEPSMADLRRFPLHLNKFLYQFLAYFTAARLHKEHHYDGVWAMMAHSTGVPAALFKRRFPGVKYILTLQEGDPPESIEKKMRPFGPLFTNAFVKADSIQVISTFLGSWAKRMGYGNAPVLIPNGVDLAHFAREFSPEAVAEMKQKLGKKEGDVFLVTTSRLVHKNAVDDIIRALALLPEHVQLLVCGTGPDETKLRALATEQSVSARVRFLGHTSREDLPLLFKACDIFVRPSRSEGMGISFVEAMAARLPVIATQEGGISDFLFDRVLNPEREATGYAAPVNDPESIKDAVLRVLSSETERLRTTENAFKLVHDEYTWESITDRMQTSVFSIL